MSFIGVFLDNKKFQILQKNMNKIDKTLINIKKKSIENVKNEIKKYYNRFRAY